ncbi:LCP family protein [Vagococcus zengguangii]|uniref:LCP family protein n=1 Tax=Vagococcus zengguangii TaxID=2571750 RepID=UPI0011097D3B|nr:LCP family protein [Vagococcus zengguangii]TLG80911.1 LytR family transcriptional regulator [Vagococcus zengguangii]
MKESQVGTRSEYRRKQKRLGIYQARREAKDTRTKKSNKVLKTAVILLLAVLVGGLFYAAKLVNKTAQVIDNSYSPISTRTDLNLDIDPINDPISILLMGVDNDADRDLDNTRTDSMILLTMSPEKEIINMVSIPRDTYTYIDVPGYYQGYEKINSAYAQGEAYARSENKNVESESAEAAIDAVEHLFSTTINYYITIDFNAFESVVDAFGGVEVEVPYDIKEQNAKGKVVVELKQGKHRLNGEQALAFARTRKKDNDIERGNRQQEVLMSLIKQAMTVGSISKLDAVLKAMDGHFWTNIDRSTIMKIGESGLTTNYQINQNKLSWMSFNYYGVSYVGLHQDSIDYVSHKVNMLLGKEPEDERDAADYEFESNGLVSPTTYPQDGMAIPD